MWAIPNNTQMPSLIIRKGLIEKVNFMRYICDTCKSIYHDPVPCWKCHTIPRELDSTEYNAIVNQFARKWLPVFRGINTPGWFDRDTGLKEEFAHAIFALGVGIDDSTFQCFFDNLTIRDVWDSTEIFLRKIDQIRDAELLVLMIFCKWRYRVSRREYTNDIKTWCVAALEQLILVTNNK